MTESELDAIQKRAEAATPAPWDSDLHIYSEEEGIEVGVFDDPKISMLFRAPANPLKADATNWRKAADSQAKRDADFIAHAREDIPALVAEIRRLRGLRAECLQRLKDAARVDPETGHARADDALLDCIDDQEIRAAFDALTRWYA